MNDDQFEILVSTDDYLNVQARCNELQKTAGALEQNNKLLLKTINDMNDLIQKNQHKQIQLQNQINKWRKINEDTCVKLEETKMEKLKLGQLLQKLNREGVEERSKLKLKEKQFKLLEVELSQVKESMKSLKKQQENQLNKKQLQSQNLKKQLTNKILQHKNTQLKNKELQGQIEDITENVTKLTKEIQQLKFKEKKTILATKQMKFQYEESKKKLQSYETQLKRFELLFKEKNEENHKLVREIQIIRQSLKFQKEVNAVHITKFNDLIGQLSLTKNNFHVLKQEYTKKNQKIKTLEEQISLKSLQVKEITQKFTQWQQQRQQMESHHQSCSSGKCSKMQKKKSRKSDRVTIQNIKIQIEQYFAELFTDLKEVGNLNTKQIQSIVWEQQQTVKNYIHDALVPFLNAQSYQSAKIGAK